MEFVDSKVGFKCVNVFLYLSFTCFNISIGKQMFRENFSQINWILVVIYEWKRY